MALLLKFAWLQDGVSWALAPSTRDDGWRLTVEPKGTYWSIVVNGAPLSGRYTSSQGAKLDAWEYVKAHARAYFGTRNVKLEDR